MKLNKWTVFLASAGVISLASAVRADEHPVNTLLSSTTLYGYVDTAAIWNFGSGTAQTTRFENTAANHQDGFNLDAIKIGLEKPLDEGTWSAGYKAELLYGAITRGLGASSYGNNIKQGYVALRVPVGNGIDFKIGKWDTIIGYEVTDSYANPNFSRSFGFALEPLVHTGVLATYQFSDVFGVAAGIANTSDDITPNNGVESRKTYLAGITVKAPESAGWLAGSSLYAGVIDAAHARGGGEDAVNIYVGGSLSTPIKGLSLGASFDHREDNSSHNAYALYASFQLNEQVKIHGRAEYANSGNGYFTGGGGKDKIFALTGTIDYSLFANVVTRAEFRWDHSASGRGLGSRMLTGIGGPIYDYADEGGVDGNSGNGGNLPVYTYGDGQKNDLSVSVNVIYKF